MCLDLNVSELCGFTLDLEVISRSSLICIETQMDVVYLLSKQVVLEKERWL